MSTNQSFDHFLCFSFFKRERDLFFSTLKIMVIVDKHLSTHSSVTAIKKKNKFDVERMNKNPFDSKTYIIC